MLRGSMSLTPLVLQCQAMLAEGALWVDSRNAASDGGTLVHEALAAMATHRAATLKSADSTLIAMFNHGANWLRENGRVGMRAEVPFAIDLETGEGREIPSKGQRDYAARKPTELPGTADLVAMGIDDRGAFVWVADWKMVFNGQKKSARDQLAALALAASRTYNVDRAKIVTLYVEESGVDDTTETHELDCFDLAAVESSLVEKFLTPDPTPRPGPHCTERYCPHLSSCPATTQAIVQVIPDAALVKQWRYVPVIESPDHLAHLVRMRPLLRKAMDQVDAAMAAMVKDGPVVTSTGERIEQATRSVSRLNMGALEALAREMGATDEQIAGCFRQSVEGAGIRIAGAAKRGRAA